MRLQQREAQPKHPRPAFDAVHHGPAFRSVEREISEDGEPIGVLARRLHGERVGIGIPAGWMDESGVDPPFIHFLQHVGRRVVGHLTMVGVGRLVVLPNVDLSVDDQHERCLPF